MVKSKAKAERAAARQAAAVAAGHMVVDPNPAVVTPPVATPSVESPAPEPEGAESQVQPEGEEVAPAPEPVPDRTELLRSKPTVVGRFMRLLLPILVDVYAASVATPLRMKTLSALLKAVSFLDGDDLKSVFTVRVCLVSI